MQLAHCTARRSSLTFLLPQGFAPLLAALLRFSSAVRAVFSLKACFVQRGSSNMHTCCSKDAHLLQQRCTGQVYLWHGRCRPVMPLAPDTCCAEADCAEMVTLLLSLGFSCGSVRGAACLLLCCVLEEAVVAGRPLLRASPTGSGRSAASSMVSEASEMTAQSHISSILHGGLELLALVVHVNFSSQN